MALRVLNFDSIRRLSSQFHAPAALQRGEKKICYPPTRKVYGLMERSERSREGKDLSPLLVVELTFIINLMCG